MDHEIEALLASPAGRRELRERMGLRPDLADRLLEFEDDFRVARRDRTLGNVIDQASPAALKNHALAISEGSAAGDLWKRLGTDTDALLACVDEVIEHGTATALRSMASWVLLDPLDTIELSRQDRIRIAIRVLSATDDESRGLAAEALRDLWPAILAERARTLVHDSSTRVRRYVWSALREQNRHAGIDLAIETFADADADIDVRRSAMTALAESLPTAELEEFLSQLVLDPDERIALAAAHLFQSLHRSPIIAAAAARSPHAEVREIARRLMDPFRGSPAAGGSRPGDPTGGDIYAEMLRGLQDDETG